MNGKNEGRKRTAVDGEKNRRAKWVSVAFRSTKETPSSMASPSICLNAGACDAIEGVAAIDHAGHDHADRRRGRVHDADLHRRRVRAQQQAPGTLFPGGRRHVEVERVVQVHRRMVGGKVEREEVVPVGLDLGTQGDGEAEFAEDLRDLVDDRGDGMHGARPSVGAPAS